jgi:hypothetical protein
LDEEKGTTEYAIKQVGDRYYPVIIDKDAGGHYEINNPLTGGVLSYNNPEAAEKYIQRTREKRWDRSRKGRSRTAPTSCADSRNHYNGLSWIEKILMYLENLF